MIKYVITIIGLISSLSCKENDSLITIVDIGHLDRVRIAKQLSIIKKYSPKVIGLDFLLTTDSLDKDILLAKEISKLKNIIQSSTLHEFIEPLNYWDRLELYHPKFQNGKFGFSNITITDDSVFVPELPMRQYYKERTIHSLSYVIAENSFGVKTKYKQNDDKDFYFDRNLIGKHFKVISVEDLLTEMFNKNDLNDKIVLMGHVSDNENSFYLDKKRTKRVSGVEIQASIIRQLLEQRHERQQ
jgi:CHASE2 domain-containing sensor protein